MTYASFTAAGYATMIEYDPNQKLQSRRKIYAPIAFGSETFNPAQLKMSKYAKEFLAIYFAFTEFGHLMWGSDFPVFVFLDNRSVTRFFQTKIIPPPLWNACDYVPQYNYSTRCRSYKRSCQFPYRAEVKPTEKFEMNVRIDVTTKAIEVNIQQSTGVAEEEPLYILPEETPTEQEKGTLRKAAKWKLTMIQKTNCQNSKTFISPPQEQLITEKDTSQTTQKIVRTKQRLKFTKF